LRESSQKEEEIEEKFELVVEYLGDEGERVVLSVLDEVVLLVDGLNSSCQPNTAFADLDLLEEVFFEATGEGGRCFVRFFF
jgi:hypothetical protein